MQFSRIGDVVLHHQMIGDPRAKPFLVFVNALGTDFRIWRDVIVRLAGDFAILAYDKRGHGLSDAAPTPMGLEDHAADLAGLIANAGSVPAFVCGVSMGGMVAQILAARRPDLVRGLVLCDTAHRVGTPEAWDARMAAVREGGIADIAEAILERWFSPDFRAPGNADFSGYYNMLVRQPAEGYLAACAALRDADLSELARRLAVPAVCVVGEHDGSTPPALVSEFARMVPNARFELIKGAGHLPSIEQPVVLGEIVRAFVDLVTAGDRPGARAH